MTSAPLLLSVPNVSEGRDPPRVEAIGAAFAPGAPARRAQRPRPRAQRATRSRRLRASWRGPCSTARARRWRTSTCAATRASIRTWARSTWCPSSMLDEERRGAACAEALTAAALIGEELALPVFLYGELATSARARRERAAIRAGGPTRLAERMAGRRAGARLRPAPRSPERRARCWSRRGRRWSRSTSIWTATTWSSPSGSRRRCASRAAGSPGVRALGLYLADRGRAQVSINVHDHRAVPLRELVERVRARRAGGGGRAGRPGARARRSRASPRTCPCATSSPSAT